MVPINCNIVFGMFQLSVPFWQIQIPYATDHNFHTYCNNKTLRVQVSLSSNMNPSAHRRRNRWESNRFRLGQSYLPGYLRNRYPYWCLEARRLLGNTHPHSKTYASPGRNTGSSGSKAGFPCRSNSLCTGTGHRIQTMGRKRKLIALRFGGVMPCWKLSVRPLNRISAGSGG